MRKITGTVIALLLSSSLLAGCGSKETANPSGGTQNKDNTVTSQPDNSVNDNDNTSQNVKDTEKDNDNPSGNIDSPKIDLGNLDDENLPVYPEDNKKLSMYYYSAKELSDEVFYPEPEDVNGVPFYFNGTLLEENDSITEYLDMNEHCKVLNGLDADAKSFKIMTKWGPVIMIDITPYQSKYYTDTYKNDVYNLRFMKSMLNNLVVYKQFPEIGDTGKFYGFYLGYSEKDECPVFTYGVSNLVRSETFAVDYLEYITDDTKHYKYRNYFEMDYPVGWSDTYEANSRISFISFYKGSSISIADFEGSDMSAEEIIKWITGDFDEEMPGPGGEDMEAPEGEGPGDYPDFDIKIFSKEKILIGADKDISAYHLEVGYNNDGSGYNMETVYIFQAKHTYILLECVDNSNMTNPSSEDNTVNEPSDVDPDDITEAPDDTEETKSVFAKEIENLLNSITICGF